MTAILTPRKSLVIVLLLLVAALPRSLPGATAEEVRNTDFSFSSAFELFYAGPRWFVEALPGAKRAPHRSVLDRAGDVVEPTGPHNRYAGTLDDVFSPGYFSDVAIFVRGTSSWTSTPLAPDALLATKYWDTTAGAGNGVGGSATWASQSDLRWSDSNTGDAALSSAAVTDAGIFEGTAGTITLGFSPTLASWTFNATGYTIATSGSVNLGVTGSISLADGVNLTLAPTAASSLNLNSSITGGSGSGLTLGGSTASATDAILVRLNATGVSIANTAPITISTTGSSGFAGFLSTSGSRVIGATITNNSGVTTMFGAGSGATLTLNGAISGTAGVRFALDGGNTASGTGTVVLGTTNTYQGSTVINIGSTGSLRLGVNDALPTGTALRFGASSSSGNVGTLDMNGRSQSVASLESITTGSHTISNASGTLSTLSITGNANTAFSGSIGAPGANNIALTLTTNHTGTLSLSGTNSYTGDTTIGGGELILTPSGSLSSSSTIRLGGTSANSPSAQFRFGNTVGGEVVANPLIVQASSSGTEGTRTLLAVGTNGNTNTWTGNITLNTDLVVQSGAAGGSAANGQGILLFTGGVIDVRDNVFIVNTRLAGNTVDTYSVQGIVRVDGVLGSSLATGGSVIKEGSGTLILSGLLNNYTGTNANVLNANGTQIRGGILGIFGDTSLGLAPTTGMNNVFFAPTGVTPTGDSIPATLRADAAGITLASTRHVNIASGVTGTIDSNGNTFTIAGVINGSGGHLNKTGAGTLVLTGNNTYTGTTTISQGILNAAATGALGGTTGSITVNNGGTLLVTGAGNLDRINNSTNIVLGGTPGSGTPTFERSGMTTVSEGAGAERNGLGPLNVTGTSSVGLGALSLQSNATFAFGTGGVGTFVFSGFNPGTFTLNVTGWTSTADVLTQMSGADGVDDRLIFAGILPPNNAFITFDGSPSALIALDNGFWEVVAAPIPEPGTWVGGALALLAIGFTQRRRLRGLVARGG